MRASTDRPHRRSTCVACSSRPIRAGMPRSSSVSTGSTPPPAIGRRTRRSDSRDDGRLPRAWRACVRPIPSATTRSCCGCGATTAACGALASAIATSTGRSPHTTSGPSPCVKSISRLRAAAALRARHGRVLRALPGDGIHRQARGAPARRDRDGSGSDRSRGLRRVAGRDWRARVVGCRTDSRPDDDAADCRWWPSPRSSPSSASRRSSTRFARGGCSAAHAAPPGRACGAGGPSSPTCSMK